MKKKHPEHVNLERWLVSYADFITLLFAFFVIMYAISQADIAKFKAASESIKSAFSGGPSGMVDAGGASGGDTINLMDGIPVPSGRVMEMPAGKTHTAKDPTGELASLKEMLEESIALEVGMTALDDSLRIEYEEHGLKLTLAVKGLFESGASEVHPDMRPLLDRIGVVLSRAKRPLRIEGHADTAEVKDAESGWMLSAARAAWVARFWSSRHEFDVKRLGIAGYSTHRPVTGSQSKWGREANRRVEVIILNSNPNTDGDDSVD